MGWREEKKQATRAALSWAAVRLTVERGFDNVLVEDIAAAAGVSPRTFNNYFSSKGEAISARHLDRYLRMVDNLRARPTGEPLWDAIRAAVVGVVQDGPAEPGDDLPDRERWFAGVGVMVRHPALQAEFLRAGARAEAALAEVIAARTGTDPDNDLYPHVMAAAVLATANTAMNRWMTRPEATDPGRDPATGVSELIIDALTMLAAGFPAPARKHPRGNTDPAPARKH